MSELESKFKDKKVIFLSCASTIFDHFHKFHNFLNNPEYIIVTYKNVIELLDYKSDYFICDDRPNGLDINKVNACKIYVGSNPKTPMEYQYRFSAIADSCNHSVRMLEENNFCVDAHLYEFMLAIGMIAHFKPKAIYILGLHICDGDINKFFDRNGHFYKADITTRNKTVYYIYYRMIDHFIPFIKSTNTPCYIVSEKGSVPLPRITFESIFLEFPEIIERDNIDLFEEFCRRIDINFYTSRHNLAKDSNLYFLFYHYFVENQFHFSETHYHLFENEKRDFMDIETEEYKNFLFNFDKSGVLNSTRKFMKRIKENLNEHMIKNYYFYRGRFEGWDDISSVRDYHNEKLFFITHGVPGQHLIPSNVILSSEINFYLEKFNLQKNDIFICEKIAEGMIIADKFKLKNGKITAIIPVRSGSTRCPRKNTRPFSDTNLLKLKIQILKNVKEINEIIVTSDSDEYLEIAISENVKIDKRSPELCSTDTKPEKVCKYVCGITNNPNIIYCTVVTPFLTSNDYSNLIKMYRKNYNCTSVGTAKLFKSFLWDENNPINYKLDDMPISQNLPNYYIPTFGATIFETERGLKEGNVLGTKPLFYVVSEIGGIDIDTSLDFVISELLFKEGIKSLEDVKKYLE